MIYGATDEQRAEWHIASNAKHYNYCLSTKFPADKEKEFGERFRDLRESFLDLEFEAEAIEMVFDIVAGVWLCVGVM
jgi:myosin heavy subunit